MKTCHGCNHPLEPLAAVRTYHAGCDPRGRAEMLERALRGLMEREPGTDNAGYTYGSVLTMHISFGALQAARAALAYKPAQMKEREG